VHLDIRYVTRFSYSGLVRESQNELRACPADDARQSLLSYRLTTSPPSRPSSFVDYWGTRVNAFGILDPHPALEIVVDASVVTRPAPLLSASARRSRLEDTAFRLAHLEYLGPTVHTDWGTDVAAEARQRAEVGGDDVVSAVLAIHRTIGMSFTYSPGATYVGVPVDEVYRRREGVCQDFAHLVIAMCRSIGVPARYVSGYLFASDHEGGAEPDDDTVVVQTHAWVEVAIPGLGWWALDPTNQQELTERHVKIGHGRDYNDVPPLRGVFAGATTETLDVTVTMRRHNGASLPAPALVPGGHGPVGSLVPGAFGASDQ
jgi:transglutaminase-like putative cysteine protease